MTDFFCVFYDIEHDKVFNFVAGIWEPLPDEIGIKHLMTLPDLPIDDENFKKRLFTILVKDIQTTFSLEGVAAMLSGSIVLISSDSSRNLDYTNIINLKDIF